MASKVNAGVSSAFPPLVSIVMSFFDMLMMLIQISSTGAGRADHRTQGT